MFVRCFVFCAGLLVIEILVDGDKAVSLGLSFAFGAYVSVQDIVHGEEWSWFE